jgi:NAD(P)-dependent dehydrogenase (short-subunit alcohol dehydrogenase family)
MGILETQVALITGAGRGIGRAIALAYAREGATLALAARSQEALAQTAQAAQALGAITTFVPTDVTDPTQVETLVRHTVECFGRLDILVNNAGIAGPVGPLQDNDVTAWMQTIQVNLIGTYLCCHAVLPIMRQQNRGKIINLSGAGATTAWANLSAYGASKVAVVRLTETLALELADTNIQVNALGPGSIHTQMWEELRDRAQEAGAEHIYTLGQKVTSGGGASLERVAEVALFLASDASGALSGRLISSVMDDFSALATQIPQIMASDALTLRRVPWAV